ncbi:helix-turn-helix transcriptional regulator [Nocardia sp. NPDC048505]|uniref:helix-turn-helix domain-containing protein n=1 Tax=Nocardia sp. NPDC048505 TaxID=3155756 RepID=UPI0033EEA7F8
MRTVLLRAIPCHARRVPVADTKPRRSIEFDISGRPSTLAGPLAIRMIAGARLQRLRELCPMDRKEVAQQANMSQSKLSRVESGSVGLHLRDVEDLLRLYAATPAQRNRVLDLARLSNEPSWWHGDCHWIPKGFDALLDLEPAAALIGVYEPRFVPDLLQSEDYARTVLSLATRTGESRHQVERKVQLRLRRQEMLHRRDSPKVRFVIEESALRRPLGGHSVWRGQLETIAKLCDLPHVTVQILADTAGGPALAESGFTYLRFPDPELGQLVSTQQMGATTLLTNPVDVHTYLESARSLAIRAESSERTSELMIKLAEHYVSDPTHDGALT